MLEAWTSFWTTELRAANLNILLHMLGAVVLGAAVGYERSYHGRAAGMRTYALVCLASTALTVIGAFPQHWFGSGTAAVHAEPTRVIQGLMTGIGFLGAGMILRDGLTIHGLSTAASIWVTAAIGILIGLGFHMAAISAAGLTVVFMSLVRWLEKKLPQQSMRHGMLRFDRARAPDEVELKTLAAAFGFELDGLSYRLVEDGRFYEYRFTLRAWGKEVRDGDLARALASDERVREFHVSPQRD